MSVNCNSGDKKIVHKSRFYFLTTKVKSLHRYLDHRDFLSIGLVRNVDENDSIKGNILGGFSFCALVKESVYPCDIFLLELELGSLISWPMKKNSIFPYKFILKC
jgi:hypothetical protein